MMEKINIFNINLSELYYDNSSELISLFIIENNNFRLVEFNKAYLELIGSSGTFPAKEIKGLYLNEIIRINNSCEISENNFTSISEKYNQVINSLSPVIYEEELKISSKNIFLETTIYPVTNADDICLYLLCVSKDITDKKILEQKIKLMATENALLLKELHHRVNNNLQIILSMIYLQSKQINEHSNLDNFREIQNRIKAMAMVYNQLINSPALSVIDFKAYINAMLVNLFFSYDRYDIKFDIVLPDIHFNTDTTIACGLMINELINNYLSKNYSGLISIYLEKLNEKTLILSLNDNNSDFNEIIQSPENISAGLSLISLMITQLNGIIRLDPNIKSKITIQFEIE